MLVRILFQTPAEVTMPRLLACLLPLAAALALAADTARLPDDSYEVVLLDGARVGSCHVRVTKYDGDDSQLRVTSSLELALKRFNTQVRLRMDSGTIEDASGKVLGVFMKQNPGTSKQLELTGSVVDEDKLLV